MLNYEKYKAKGYPHFDHKIHIKNVESYVVDPLRIAKHSFLPFIYYESKSEKYVGKPNSEMKNRPIKPKNRDIMYAGHLDNFIYKYYADRLNEAYNEYTDDNNLDDCSTAYRDNKKEQSNIEFAAEVINKIVDYEDAFIMVGDFTSFFDKIDHCLLKEQLSKVCKVNRLSKDWYNVYRSITKYGYYIKKKLIEQLQKEGLFHEKNKSYFKNVKEFRRFQRRHPCLYNREKYGIPQGSAISAVFANVYAIEFDKEMQSISDKYHGLYRRYSDDFVLVIPKYYNDKVFSLESFIHLEKEVREIANNNEIILQEDKTAILEYRQNTIINYQDKEKSRLDYLGFIFDGETVKMRGKSAYKFYRQADKLISWAHKVKRQKNLEKLPYRKKIYELYSDLCPEYGKPNNFISYANRAQKSFDELSPRTNNIMMNQIKNRKKKIEKILGMKIHSKK